MSIVSLPSDVSVSLPSDDVSDDGSHEVAVEVVNDDEAVILPEDVADRIVLPDNLSDDGSNEGFNELDDCADLNDLDIDCEVTGPEFDAPSPGTVMKEVQHVAEFYSQPRVVPQAQKQGMRAQLSLDIITGWNFLCKRVRSISLELLQLPMIVVLILSPPCTVFSDIQRLWNIKKYAKDVWASRWADGMCLLDHSMECAEMQVKMNNIFVFEHPVRATSWSQASVKRVAAIPGVDSITIDMCMLGLVSKVEGLPMRKRTRIMTNSKPLLQLLKGKRCDKSHDHRLIWGYEGGQTRTSWAQIYPKPFVDLLVAAAQVHVRMV